MYLKRFHSVMKYTEEKALFLNPFLIPPALIYMEAIRPSNSINPIIGTE